jgi:hypothetical protein
MGLSQHLTREVPQVLNISMGSITTQFHIAFDDQFTTDNSIDQEMEPLCQWEELCLENYVQVITEDQYHCLNHDWFIKEELDLKRKDTPREMSIRNSQLHRLSSNHHIAPHDTQVREQREEREQDLELAVPIDNLK